MTISPAQQWTYLADARPGRLARASRQLHRELVWAVRLRAEKRRGEESLLSWGRRMLPDHFSRPPSRMHRWLARELDRLRDRPGMKLNVLGPRGAAKSTFVTLAFVLRVAVEAQQPYIWIVSDTRSQAEAHLENIKAELLGNRRLARWYPEACGMGPVWRRGAVRLASGTQIEAFGTGQRIRGRRHRMHRPRLIICDDLENDQHVESPAQRAKTRAWFHSALLRAGTKETCVVNLATALHRSALAVELTRTPGWRSRTFRAILRWPRQAALWRQWQTLYSNAENPRAAEDARRFYDEHRRQMHEGVRLLWPEVDDLYTLMCQRAESGPAAFAREKQNRPRSPEMCEWPERYFQGELWFEQWPEDLRLKTMALDPSKGSDARRGDYSALVLLGVDARGLIYVQADLARRPTTQMVAEGVSLYRQFQPDGFAVEINQFQHLLAEAFEAEFHRQGVLAPRPYGLDNRVNKRLRIRRLGPYLAARRMRFKARCSSTALLLDQLRDFPCGDHDDGPDALEMALRLASVLAGQHDVPDNLGDRIEVGS